MKKFVLAIVFIVVVLCFAVASGLFLPRKFEMSRIILIESSQPRVIQHLMNLSTWPDWWPWDKRRNKFQTSSIATGIGSTMSWSERPAPGRLVITGASIYSIDYDIFLEGSRDPLKGSFNMKTTAEGTYVTWKISGMFETPVLAPFLALIADSMHGGMLSWGLKNLKTQVESDNSDLELLYKDEQGRDVSEVVH